ncbi:MAG: hypothetical protein LBO69_05070 [Ignavibacteria bacterium]|jgi:hypothetical protein|nr:hypothetical protein [Ignavibacteria bacterium]
MKKVLILVAIIFATTLTASAQFSGGSGTQADPYQITSKADMEELADVVNTSSYFYNGTQDKYYKLMNNITDSVQLMIGIYGHRDFKGDFDGNGYKITLALLHHTTAPDELALFCSNYGTIRNLVVDGYVNDNSSRCAGICRANYANIFNCKNLANIIGELAAGIAQYNDGTIDSCVNNGYISASGYPGAGGICVFIVDGDSISNCTNTGTVVATGGGAGGIVSQIATLISAAVVADCVNSGLIKGTNKVGGIVGISSGYCHITKCINTNVVEGTDFVGAILGEISGNTTITDCFYDIQMCKYKAVNNQDHPGVTGLPTHLLMEELAK